MNSQGIKHIIILLVLFTSCTVSSYDVHYLDESYLKERFGSLNNDFLGWRFFLDTITINKPCMALYKNELYIMPSDYQHEFVESPGYCEGIKLFRVLPHNIRQDVLSFEKVPANHNDFSCRTLSQLLMAESGHGLYSPYTYNNGQVVFERRINDIEFYSFMIQPSRFLVELVWYDPDRYMDNPYGPNFITIIDESKVTDDYANKLDSLESVPIRTQRINEPQYVLTVEPLYSRKSINKYIKDNEAVERWGPFVTWRPKLFSRKYAKKFCLPDL